MRELILHQAHDRLAGFGGQTCILHDIRSKFCVKICHSLHNGQVLFGQDTPRSYGELHHRHEGVNLSRANDKGLIELVILDVKESGKLTSAYHVRARVSIAEKSGHAHLRNQLLYGVPTVVFVAKALNQRLSAHLPTSAILVEGELQTYLGPGSGVVHVSGFGVVCQIRSRSIAVVVARIELETVYSILGLRLFEHLNEIVRSSRVREVITCGIAVPPIEYSRAAVRVAEQETFAFQVTELRRIGADERAYPHHDFESEGVELVYHTFGVGETLGLEGKIAVVALPVVVYHQHSCREAVIDDGMRIAKDILLVLVVHQFNPGVVLRTREEERVRQQTGRREMGRLSRQICLAQGRTRLDYLQRNRRTYLAVYG